MKDQPLIEDFSLDVKLGQCGDLSVQPEVGTLILLMRFYDTNSGKLAIDGLSIEDITRQSLRNGFECFKKHGFKRESVREKYHDGPTISEEEMIASQNPLPYSWICKPSATRI